MESIPACNITDGKYKYTQDLLALEATATGLGPTTFRPASPLEIKAWHKYLRLHPDQTFANYILAGIEHGFHIGVDHNAVTLKSARQNLKSGHEHLELVTQQLREEVQTGCLLGPLPQKLAESCQISPLGLIPKPNQPGRWRLIVDLSSPGGCSVNDAIDPNLCSLTYASVDDAVHIIRQQGRGTLLAKLDLKKAYHMVPVHPDDHALLAVRLGADTYVDTALPFGLHSAPKIFSAIADALAWCLHCKGVRCQLHYLDDFLFLGPPDNAICTSTLQVALDTCEELGMPVAGEKVEGPSTCLTFLGIQINTQVMELSLPNGKLARVQSLIKSWSTRKAAPKRDLQLLIGHLSHAATVVPPGRSFLRHLIDKAKVGKRPHHLIRLNTETRSDIAWWATFLTQWNGQSVMPALSPAVTITSDASGSWGCGAVTSDGRWLQLQWPQSWEDINIAAKELVPVVIAIAIWGKHWQGQTVLCRSDNMAVVAALKAGSARDQLLMHLLRCLHFFTAHAQLCITTCHIPGKLNIRADAISRNHPNPPSIIPQCTTQPSTIPSALVDILLHSRPDWTSPSWRQLFNRTLREV